MVTLKTPDEPDERLYPPGHPETRYLYSGEIQAWVKSVMAHFADTYHFSGGAEAERREGLDPRRYVSIHAGVRWVRRFYPTFNPADEHFAELARSRVGIVMPAYNAERYIAESIQSVLAQTYEKWELIVVDDGSTDKTAEVVHSFSDPRVKVLSQPNHGLARARNAGVRAVSGPWVAFLDSDDLWMPEKLERQIVYTPRADVVYTNGYVFDGDETGHESLKVSDALVAGFTPGRKMLPLLIEVNRIPVLSVLLLREAFDAAGGFDEEMTSGCEDYDLWMRLARAERSFYGLDEPLIRYRRHAASMSRNLKQMRRSMADALRKQGEQARPRLEELTCGADGLSWRLTRLARRVRASARYRLGVGRSR